jgi:lysophospholipase L1-like esterase
LAGERQPSYQTGSRMRRAPGFALPAAFVAAAAAAAPDGTSSPEAPRRVYSVAAIGDSLTDPKSHGGKYLDRLRLRCPESRFDAHGRGGNMVNQMRRRFARDVLGEPADPGSPKPSYGHVIVFGGVNDIYSDVTAGRTPRLIARDLAAMYAAARAHGMRVVAVTVAPWGGFKRYFTPKRGAATRALNAWIRTQRDAGTVDHVVDAWSLLSCGVPDRLCKRFVKPFNDGLHFGPAGHELLGDALWREAFSDCR